MFMIYCLSNLDSNSDDRSDREWGLYLSDVKLKEILKFSEAFLWRLKETLKKLLNFVESCT